MDLFKVEDDVRAILKENEQSRADDMILYAAYAWMVLERAGAKNGAGWLEKVFADIRFRTIYGIAPYGCVSRTRRKIQETTEDLRPTEEDIQARKEKIKEYRNYARGIRKDHQGALCS